VRELLRLLKPGGRALIYVWAFEQEFNRQRSKYLREPPENRGSPAEDTEPAADHREPPGTSSTREDAAGKLGVHTNRTAFHSQDLLVPWHLKEGKKPAEEEVRDGGKKDKRKGKHTKTSGDACSSTPTRDLNPDPRSADSTARTPGAALGPAPVFHRYYHVFQQGELERLCGQEAGVRVQSGYHDQGNWCVVLVKD